MGEFKSTETTASAKKQGKKDITELFVEMITNTLIQLADAREERDDALATCRDLEFDVMKWKIVAALSLIGFVANLVSPWIYK